MNINDFNSSRRRIRLNEDGRIVRGVNTTCDVDVDETKVQAIKYGNDVTVGGIPPTLRTDGVFRHAILSHICK